MSGKVKQLRKGTVPQWPDRTVPWIRRVFPNPLRLVLVAVAGVREFVRVHYLRKNSR